MHKLHVEVRPAHGVMGNDLEVGVQVDAVRVAKPYARAWPKVEFVSARCGHNGAVGAIGRELIKDVSGGAKIEIRRDGVGGGEIIVDELPALAVSVDEARDWRRVGKGAAHEAIIVEPADLDREASGHDSELLEFVERSLIASTEREPLEFRAQLNRTLDYLLAIKTPRLCSAASAMGVSSRTLQRRLASEGVSFQQLLCEARRRVVEDCLRKQKRPSLALLAEQTGYSDASAVSRFLRTQSGQRERS